MERRRLLKALTALPMIPVVGVAARLGGGVAKAVEVPAKGRFVIFIDAMQPESVINGLCDSRIEGHPLEGSPIHVLCPRGDQTLEDCIKIYKIED